VGKNLLQGNRLGEKGTTEEGLPEKAWEEKKGAPKTTRSREGPGGHSGTCLPKKEANLEIGMGKGLN